MDFQALCHTTVPTFFNLCYLLKKITPEALWPDDVFVCCYYCFFLLNVDVNEVLIKECVSVSVIVIVSWFH